MKFRSKSIYILVVNGQDVKFFGLLIEADLALLEPSGVTIVRGEKNDVFDLLGINSLTSVLEGHIERDRRIEKISSGTETLKDEKWLSFLLIFTHLIRSKETLGFGCIEVIRVFI